VQPCPTCKLDSIKVIRDAYDTYSSVPKSWGTVKNAGGEVIVEAKTIPDDEDTWRRIVWSGDAGDPVPGKSNQRKLSRAVSTKLRIEAELGGVKDYLEVWVLWAEVTILDSGTTPPNAVQYGKDLDGTETLGAVFLDKKGRAAAGKVIPFARITPPGVHAVIKQGWEIHREVQAHEFVDGVKDTHDPRTWSEPAWFPDTSAPAKKRLVPDDDDKIYDNDAPDVFRGAGGRPGISSST
jgi:hypothetical protein